MRLFIHAGIIIVHVVNAQAGIDLDLQEHSGFSTGRVKLCRFRNKTRFINNPMLHLKI